jgi:UPF0755 protein
MLKKFLNSDIFSRPKIIIPVIIFVVLLGIIFCTFVYSALPPQDFPEKAIVNIKPSTGLSAISKSLLDKRIIKSEFLFKSVTVLMGAYKKTQAGEYLFNEPESVVRIAYRISKGIHGLSKIKVSIYEGADTIAMGKIIKQSIPEFDDKTFVAEAKQYEGYLFPDTYFFYPNVSPEEVVEVLSKNFEDKVVFEDEVIEQTGHSLEDIIKMASIVEREATGFEDKKIIAGILWKRIEKGMPLQVDPPFYYILRKDSSSITLKDLKIDSPYNLYKYKGLPPTPISNPGLDAIRATIDPIKTNYYFFLSGQDGKMHYAPTYDGHLINKAKYL